MTSHLGKCVKAYILTCLYCRREAVYYSTNGKPVPQSLAERWARNDGWTKTKQGWAHKTCVPVVTPTAT
jgi:hypothetical protein